MSKIKVASFFLGHDAYFSSCFTVHCVVVLCVLWCFFYVSAS